ncbi:hypothetical protein SAMN05444695_12315 [Rhodococcus triatomae]|uniref:Uncharacterized protein n=1 Tax=Rhodococcus triatomae TaxID=300028 RepID=A0A1G8SPW0_9NOCA|nr:hypothetical protein [Rhodococcus triatomae]SDJ31262.1 hypothetical protein SAMN05444695_12315 [Rhodococcus triatomae]
MTAVRADQEREVLTAATSMVQTLLGSQDRTLVRQVLLAGFPWVELLSDEETAEFIDELISSLRQGTSLGNPAPPAHTIEMWRHTAEVYADPNLARALSSPSEEDSGTVPIPKR